MSRQLSPILIILTRCLAGVMLALGLALAAGCDLQPNQPDRSQQIVRMGSPIPSDAAPTPPDDFREINASTTVSPTPTMLPAADRREIFDAVWYIVNDDYLYTDFKGVDWAKMYTEYRPKAMQATSAQQFYATISSMVSQLKDDHSSYLSPWEAREEDGFVNGRVSYVGIGVMTRDDEGSIAVTYVFPKSPADQAGIKRRDRIIAVNGKPATSNDDEATSESNIRGPMFSTVQLTVQSPGQPPRDVTVERRLVGGRARATSRLMESDPTVGYMIVPSLFVGDMGVQVEEQLTNLYRQSLLRDQPLKGLVIDLRGNGGGWFNVMKSIAGQFTVGEAGTFFSNNIYVQGELASKGNNRLDIPKGELYEEMQHVRLVFLVDEETASSAEILPAILQAQGRAQVVGVPSMGNTESIYYYDLKDGSRLWIAEAAFRLPDGTNLEGQGVVPDAKVEVDWVDYPERDDPQIHKAVEVIHQTK